MYAQVITYTVSGMNEQEWKAATEPAAPIIGTTPGLISKTWIADAETSTYGGLYLWESLDAIDQFMNSETVRDLAANPAIGNLSARVFSVWEEHSRVTRGAAVPALAQRS
jgi:hypothetical protein